jgi:hypothetical protein
MKSLDSTVGLKKYNVDIELLNGRLTIYISKLVCEFSYE